MRYFDLLQIQHFVLYLFPALATIVVFALGLHFTYFRGKDSKQRETKIIEEYPGGIKGRNAPMPIIIILTIAGTVIWSVVYIFFIRFMGGKI